MGIRLTADEIATVRLSRSPLRWLIVLMAAFVSILASGVVFGWASLELTLIDIGVYNYKCGGLHQCPAQQEQLDLVYTYSCCAFNMAYLPAGIILDRFGPKFTSSIGAIIITVGSILFSLSSAPYFDTTLPGFMMISIGGPFVSLSVMSFSFLMPSKSGTIVTLFIAMLDSSCLMFTLLVSFSFVFHNIIINFCTFMFVARTFWPLISTIL